MNFFREIVVALPAELFLLQKHNDKKFVKVQHPIKGFLIFWCFFGNLAIFPPPHQRRSGFSSGCLRREFSY
jgi:hypothetical protein